jgi:hypothetical protein
LRYPRGRTVSVVSTATQFDQPGATLDRLYSGSSFASMAETAETSLSLGHSTGIYETISEPDRPLRRPLSVRSSPSPSFSASASSCHSNHSNRPKEAATAAADYEPIRARPLSLTAPIYMADSSGADVPCSEVVRVGRRPVQQRTSIVIAEEVYERQPHVQQGQHVEASAGVATTDAVEGEDPVPIYASVNKVRRQLAAAPALPARRRTLFMDDAFDAGSPPDLWTLGGGLDDGGVSSVTDELCEFAIEVPVKKMENEYEDPENLTARALPAKQFKIGFDYADPNSRGESKLLQDVADPSDMTTV